MVQRMGAIIGKPLKLVDIPVAVAREGMVAAGIPASQAEGFLRYCEYGVKAGQNYSPTPTVAELLGRAAQLRRMGPG
jgi:hypothetical protein